MVVEKRRTERQYSRAALYSCAKLPNAIDLRTDVICSLKWSRGNLMRMIAFTRTELIDMSRHYSTRVVFGVAENLEYV